METRTPWVLNFDADLELDDPAYQRSRAVDARFLELSARVSDLTREGPPGCGYAFCPTPSALRKLAAMGATHALCPSLQILQKANHRSFCHSLPDRLPSSALATSVDDITRAIRNPNAESGWFLRRPFGFAGRGRKRIAHDLSSDIVAWLDATFRKGECIEVVPIVERVLDVSQHAFLTRSGTLTAGELTVQQCDAHGAWLSTRRCDAGEVDIATVRAMRATLDLVGERLHALGYFGPFGIDGFLWRSTDGDVALHACSDVNARYSMGWSVGMGDVRPDLNDEV